MHRNPSVNVHQFAMVPKADIPRSSFLKQFTHKTTFDENGLVPIYVDEVLPGDTFSLSLTAFARMTTPIYPVMDNLYMDTFFFFVPNRLVWSNWVRFMGEQDNPADSISYTIPQVVSNNAGFPACSIADYMGCPTVGQVGAGVGVSVSALPGRAYAKIYNDWFRDENLVNAAYLITTDGPDSNVLMNLTPLKRAKKHDYFTSALPWTQKGGVAVTIPITGNAPVKTGTRQVTGVQAEAKWALATSGTEQATTAGAGFTSTGALGTNAGTVGVAGSGLYPDNLYADLSAVTSATINQLRQSFQIQKLLERDARGGTRYTEIIRAHFGVISPDARLQRSEYLGGGSTPVSVSPIPQTAQTGLTGGSTPLGTLGGYGTILAQGQGFTQSFTEHGHIIGLANIRGDITYQQGLRKMWSRSTKYDFYFPAFAMLGEQAILNKEIYIDGSANDALTFGYQERWGEYRYHPSMITGQLKSTTATPLDAWHLAEKFTSLPALNSTFIASNVPVSRVSAVPVANTHFIFDSFFSIKCTRPMPLYSVPGMIDHF